MKKEESFPVHPFFMSTNGDVDEEDEEDVCAAASVSAFLFQALTNDGSSSDEDSAHVQVGSTTNLPPSESGKQKMDSRGLGTAPVALPSADDLDTLAAEHGAFLRPAKQPLEADPDGPSWRLTPAEQQAASRAAAAAASAARPAMVLPMNRYGRGLNMLQLTVELSARAAFAPGPAESSDGRVQESTSGAKRKADEHDEQKNKGGIKRSSAGRRGEEQRTTREEGWV